MNFNVFKLPVMEHGREPQGSKVQVAIEQCPYGLEIILGDGTADELRSLPSLYLERRIDGWLLVLPNKDSDDNGGLLAIKDSGEITLVQEQRAPVVITEHLPASFLS